MTQGVPVGHAAPVLRLPDSALSALFEQAGVIRVDDLTQLFDVAQLLAYQPLPAGRRVGVVSNSDALALLAVDACLAAGLEPCPASNLGARAGAADYRRALAELGDQVDAIVAIYMPPVPGNAAEVAAELVRTATASGKPLLATFEGRLGMPPELRVPSPAGDGDPGKGSVPSYPAPEEAVRALAHAVRYACGRERPPVAAESLADVDTAGAQSLVAKAIESGGAEEIDAADLLARYGVDVWPAVAARSADEGVAVAGRLGWPVVVRSADPEVTHRAGAVRLGLSDADDVRRAYEDLTALLGPDVTLAVQRMAPQPAVTVVVRAVDDPDFGAVVSFGLGDVTARLLGDEAFRLAPLTSRDAADLVRSVRAAPLLFGGHGYPPVAVHALEDLLLRVGRLADELPGVTRLVLDPVLVAADAVYVLGARAAVHPPTTPRPDHGPRRLR
jgi:acyl-CoA synthetase (NDP forming)